MSSTPLDLPILFSQLPHVQKLANAELAKPELQKQLFGPMIAENLRKQGREQVQNIEKKDKTDAIDRDGSNKQEQEFQNPDKGKNKEAAEEQQTTTSNASPWAGNIINVKI